MDYGYSPVMVGRTDKGQSTTDSATQQIYGILDVSAAQATAESCRRRATAVNTNRVRRAQACVRASMTGADEAPHVSQ